MTKFRSIGFVILASVAFLLICVARQQNSMSDTMLPEASAAEPPATGFAVVELFTSEGCSSCPSADKNLENIADEARKSQRPIYCLSYHVDYWNQLGWTDPFSDVRYTERQSLYAKHFKARGVYTPQMVVNGQVEFVGSRGKDAARAIDAAVKSQAAASLQLTAHISGNKSPAVSVTYELAGESADSVLHIALVQRVGERDVSSGENAGRKLRHANIVRAVITIERPESKGAQTIEAPKDFHAEDFGVIAFLQHKDTMAISAAIGSSIEHKNPF